MFKKKAFLVTFEGIEGSGKSYHCKKLFKRLIKHRFPAIITREPGGLKNTNQIRKILLKGKKNKFNRFTDMLLYLAARSENVDKIIKPALLNKKIIICDRFIDSTIAYQFYGFGINKNIINILHKEILESIKPNLTFLLKLNVNEAIKRINKRKVINRYDRLTKKFYAKAQKGYLSLAKKNKKRYIVLDTSRNIKDIEKAIYDNFLRIFKK